MQVTFDDQVFTLQQRGGISRYFTELISSFATDPDLDVTPVTPFRYVLNDHLREYAPERFHRAHLPSAAQRDRVLRPLNRVRLAPRPPADVLHHTYYLPDGLDRRAATRVCTIYDMTPEVFPELFPAGSPHAAKRDYVERCDAIACISETTRRDLIRFYGPLDKPVVVTPLGAGEAFFAQSPVVVDPDPYFLFVGHRGGYKNFDVVLRALALMPQPPRLLCLGHPFAADEQARIAELELRVESRRAGDQELPGLYAGALALVFPSRYEGFGLPIVEAFAAGCPVVVADTPCSREVGADAALFFPPEQESFLAALLDWLAGDPGARRFRIDAGRRRAEDFHWRRTAALTGELYRTVTAACPAG